MITNEEEIIILVYLGGPIDLVTDEERTDWRSKLKFILQAEGISSFDPCAAFNINLTDRSDCARLVEINERALGTCDTAVFVMSKSQPSIGTPIEMFAAHHMGKQAIVVWNDEGPLPAYVTNYAGVVVRTIDEAAAMLAERADAAKTAYLNAEAVTASTDVARSYIDQGHGEDWPE